MVLIKGLIHEEHGQGLTEYAFILGLVVLGIWTLTESLGLSDMLNTRLRHIRIAINNCC